MFQRFWRLFKNRQSPSKSSVLDVHLYAPKRATKSLPGLQTTAGQGVIAKIYEGLSGFGIPSEEEDKIRKCHSAPTYGEMVPPSVTEMIQVINITSDDVFYDFGSGVGKVAMQVALESPVKKSIGVELADSRFQQSRVALDRLKKSHPGVASRLEYRHLNFSAADISDATVLFMCSTCYPNELLNRLSQQFVSVGRGFRVISLKALPPHPNLRLDKTLHLKMTWSESSAVNFYTVI